MRPSNLDELLVLLERLAAYGVAEADSSMMAWMADVGITRTLEDRWVTPTTSWLSDVTPAKGPTDLLRRTLLRDRQYRFHLDAMAASVLHTIGASARWVRLEELLFGRFLPFAPRFALLLEWLGRRTGLPCVEFGESSWRELINPAGEDQPQVFAMWDERLWGTQGAAATLFPLLGDLYLPLMEQPVHIDVSRSQMSSEAKDLLAKVVAGAADGEGVSVSQSEVHRVEELFGECLPVRLYGSSHGAHEMVALVGRVTVASSDLPTLATPNLTPVPGGVPEAARRSACEERAGLAGQQVDFWSTVDSRARSPVFFCVPHDGADWPREDVSVAPGGNPIPGAEKLQQVGRPRQLSPGADEALRNLSDHPLYGFLLQVLLLEALDRELGEDTLNLVPPLDRRVDDIEAATVVLFRPREIQGESKVPEGGYPAFEIGSLDGVLGHLARVVGLDPLIQVYQDTAQSPWSRAFRLLRSAHVLHGFADHWGLDPDVLDRLHGGGMLTSVIRRGRDFREHLHSHLETLWNERRMSRQETGVA